MNTEYMPIGAVAKTLKMSINGVRCMVRRGVLVSRLVAKHSRLCMEIECQSLERAIKLGWRGKRKRGPRRSVPSISRSKDVHGYVRVYCPEHPRAWCDGYVYEQWLIMEAQIGRHLTKQETVHHKNRIRDDNRPENLVLYASKSEHYRLAHGELKHGLRNLNLQHD